MNINDLAMGEALDVAAQLTHATEVSAAELAAALIGALNRIAVLEGKCRKAKGNLELGDGVCNCPLSRMTLQQGLSGVDDSLRGALWALGADNCPDVDQAQAIMLIRGARAVLVRHMEELRRYK